MRRKGNAVPQELSDDLNKIIRGWSNYFRISGVSYPKKALRDLRYYLMKKLTRYYYRKSQRKSKLYRQGAFDVLVANYGLIDPSKC
ncbi:MAG: group II intron maturase-specific domain-containing protein [Chloroflexota bacterium]|nr:group II intron maturase-specific domain-containing protein [Chloroflexota bacterium]